MTYVNKSSVNGISIFFPLLALMSIYGRYYARRLKKQTIGVDDILCIPAWMLQVTCAGLLIYGTTIDAVGSHSPQGAESPLGIEAEKINFAFELLFIIALGLVKISMLLFFRRIFRGQAFTVLNWGLIAAVAVWTVSFTFAYAFDCKTQFQANWGSMQDLTTKCDKYLDMNVANAATDVAIDILIILLPLPFVYRLQMPLTQRLSVCFMFLSGSFAIACGIVRMDFFAEVQRANFAPVPLLGLHAQDSLGVVSLYLFWPMMELGVALVACCLPSLKPLFIPILGEKLKASVRSKVSLSSWPRNRRNPARVDWNPQRPSVASTAGLRLGDYSSNRGDSYDLEEMSALPRVTGVKRGASVNVDHV